MKKVILVGSCLLAAGFLLRCNNPTATNDKNGGGAAAGIQPMAFPDPKIPGFKFPEDSVTINKWLDTYDTASIALHGWGIWAGLTTKTGDTIGNEDIYIFETWNSPKDIKDTLIREAAKTTLEAGARPGKQRKELEEPRQLEHAARAQQMAEAKRGGAKANVSSTKPCNQPQYTDGVHQLLVTIVYDIPAAQHIIGNKLYDSSVLTTMLTGGKANIPEFPNTSIVVKPTYELIHKASIKDGMFTFRVWDGPNLCDSGFGQSQWNSVVYVDVNNKSAGDGSIDNSNQGKRTPGNTYNLNSFIYYTVTDKDAARIGHGAVPGDLVVLVGMHVTSKEIKRWTWQTFWWSPNTANPPAPSSAFIAGKRPAQIVGAPAHYAMAIGYSFTWPNQPLVGGTKNGTSQIAFNPFLEAGFNTATFYEPGIVVGSKGNVVYNRVGCQTGCMSCHALAVFANGVATNPKLGQQPSNYIPDTYIDMVTDTNFKGRLQLDFLWSIQGNLISK